MDWWCSMFVKNFRRGEIYNYFTCSTECNRLLAIEWPPLPTFVQCLAKYLFECSPVFPIPIPVFGHPCKYVNISCGFMPFRSSLGLWDIANTNHDRENKNKKNVGKNEGQRNGQLVHRGKLFILKWVTVLWVIFHMWHESMSLCLTGASVIFLDWDPKCNTLNPSPFRTLNIPVAFFQSDKA